MNALSRISNLYHGLPLFVSVQKRFSSTILTENINGKKILTLNRPEKLNTLDLSMVRELADQKVNEQNRTNLVLLKANGRAFCAGGDVVAVVDSFKAGTSYCRDFFREEYELNRLIYDLKVPFVALINGITMGGGCGISINGRFQVATEQTMLAMPETALGLFPDVGGTYFLPRLKNNLGLFLGLTGYRLRGADAYHAGLASHFAFSKSMPEITDALINLSSNQCTFENVDSVLKQFAPSVIPPFSLEPYIEEIENCFNADTLECVFEQLDRSKSDFAKKQLDELLKMSPTSLKVTFHQIKLGASLNYYDVIPLEFRLTQSFLADHDLAEGCRAILKDKDRNPKWKPTKIADVTDEKVNSYFTG